MTRITHNLDDYTKQACWIINNQKCFYCREPLAFKNLQIDHVIPVRIFKANENELRNKYNLENNFDFNSLDNFVPACPSCNSFRKREKEIPAGIPLWLDDCKNKKLKIILLGKKIKRELSLDLPDQFKDFFVSSPDFLLSELTTERIRKIDIELYKNLSFDQVYWPLTLTSPNNNHEKIQINNLKQYETWSKKGYFGLTTPDIAMSSICNACLIFFEHFERAVYIQNHISLQDYYKQLPISIFRGTSIQEEDKKNNIGSIPIGEYLHQNNNTSTYEEDNRVIIVIKHVEANEAEIYIIKEILQADFTGQGRHEAILFVHYKSAGSLNYTFCLLVSHDNEKWISEDL